MVVKGAEFYKLSPACVWGRDKNGAPLTRKRDTLQVFEKFLPRLGAFLKEDDDDQLVLRIYKCVVKHLYK